MYDFMFAIKMDSCLHILSDINHYFNGLWVAKPPQFQKSLVFNFLIFMICSMKFCISG